MRNYVFYNTNGDIVGWGALSPSTAPLNTPPGCSFKEVDKLYNGIQYKIVDGSIVEKTE